MALQTKPLLRYLGREALNTPNPAQNYVRMALVAPVADCVDAAQRIVNLLTPSL
jgi:N-succinyldiaminopimelate aminotransferase